MLFSTVAPIILIPLALASPLIKRQTTDNAALVLADIGNVENEITTLNNTLNGFPPLDPLGLLVALKIQQQTQDLGDAITKTTRDAQSSSSFTSDESGDVATAVVNLVPNIQSLLTNIVAHKPSFATAVFFFGDLSKTVESDLQTQAADSAALSTALQSKLAEPYADFAPLIAGQISSAFDTAIAKYQSCSGVFCLPSLSGLPLE